MQFNWLLFLSAVTVAYAAVIPQGDIPVKVIYEREEAHRVYVRNLGQTEQDEVKQEIAAENIAKPEEIKEEVTSEVYSNALKNHDEKVQLSSEELPDALRHLPKETEEITNEAEDVPKEIEEKNNLKIVVPDANPAAQITPQQPSEDDKFFDRVQEIINNGLTRIKEDVKQSQEVVAPEIWTSFNENVDNLLKNVKNKNSLRQSSNGTFLEQFSSLTNGFIAQLTGQNTNQNQQDNTQQPGFGQNVAQAIQNGFNQIQSSLTSAFSGNPASSGAADPGASTPAPGGLQGFVHQAQNAFTNLLNPPQNTADENPNPNPIQNFQNSISSALGNLNIFNRPANGLGDESSTQGGPIQSIQSALSNLPIFSSWASTTAKPSDSSSSNPISSNLIPSIPGNNPLQGIGSQISNAVSGSTPGLGTNPLEGVTNQISNAVSGSNNIPGSNLIPSGGLSGGNPIQGLTDQISNAVGNIPSVPGNNPLEGLAQQVGNAVSASVPSS